MTTPQPQPSPSSPSSASSACPSSYGRIVRLHFACEARLPIGSSLRVTSSQLWAPGSLTPSDPNDAHKISVKAHESALPDNQNQMEMEFDDTDAAAGCYASSVEMVTSPEDWPVWKTRKPVVIALRHHHGRVEQHRYRYLVVTPGVGNSNSGTNSSSGTKDEGMTMNGEEEEEGAGIGIVMDDTNHSLKNMRGRGSYTTSDDGTISQEVMAWEDPFQDNDNDKSKTLSAVSLPSVRRNAMSKTLANLPYRTLHIDTITATVQHPSNMDSNDDNNQHQAYRYRFTSDNIQIDTWNKGDDYSFYPYTLREQLNKQNKAKKLLIKQVTNTNNDTNSDTNNDANNAVSSNNDILPELQDTETNREVPVKLSSKVSFSNLVEISTSHHNEPFSSTNLSSRQSSTQGS